MLLVNILVIFTLLLNGFFMGVSILALFHLTMVRSAMGNSPKKFPLDYLDTLNDTIKDQSMRIVGHLSCIATVSLLYCML